MRGTSVIAVAIVTVLACRPAATLAGQATEVASFQPPQGRLSPRDLSLPLLLDDQTAQLVFALDGMAFAAFGGTGYEGRSSEGEGAARRLAARPRAALALAWLVVHGRPVARVYAYWALRRVDPVAARGYRARLRADLTGVPLMTGCVGRTSTVALSVREAERHDF